jgi:hypothetical protein
MKPLLFLATALALVSCETLDKPLFPVESPGVSVVHILDETGARVTTHQVRPGTVGYNIGRDELRFVDTSGRTHVLKNKSWEAR